MNRSEHLHDCLISAKVIPIRLLYACVPLILPVISPNDIFTYLTSSGVVFGALIVHRLEHSSLYWTTDTETPGTNLEEFWLTQLGSYATSFGFARVSTPGTHSTSYASGTGTISIYLASFFKKQKNFTFQKFFVPFIKAITLKAKPRVKGP